MCPSSVCFRCASVEEQEEKGFMVESKARGSGSLGFVRCDCVKSRHGLFVKCEVLESLVKLTGSDLYVLYPK